MATTYLDAATIRQAGRPDTLRFFLVVRITHWLNTISFVGLVVSGFGILLAHTRFYWGETGGLGTPSILDLPLPFLNTSNPFVFHTLGRIMRELN
jgi:Ni,Fe-hydrogenase I cytochrome b subunit